MSHYGAVVAVVLDLLCRRRRRRRRGCRHGCRRRHRRRILIDMCDVNVYLCRSVKSAGTIVIQLNM